jgi:hypothetical protein
MVKEIQGKKIEVIWDDIAYRNVAHMVLCTSLRWIAYLTSSFLNSNAKRKKQAWFVLIIFSR